MTVKQKALELQSHSLVSFRVCVLIAVCIVAPYFIVSFLHDGGASRVEQQCVESLNLALSEREKAQSSAIAAELEASSMAEALEAARVAQGECGVGGVLPMDRRAVNLLAPVMMLEHHPVFFKFTPHIQDITPGDPFVWDFVKMKTRRDRYCNAVYMNQPVRASGTP